MTDSNAAPRRILESGAIDRRAFIAGLAGTGAAASLPSRAMAQAKDALELNAVQPWEIKSVVPREAGDRWTRAGVTETLVAVEPDGSLVPALATRWSAAEDARTWRLELRAGVAFHDGTPADPKAVLDSLQRLAPHASYLSNARIASIDLDGTTIVIRTAAPFALLPAYLADPTLPILARASFDEKGDVVRLVATGPFKIESMDLPRGARLLRHDAYWGKKPAAARVNFQAVPNGETRSNIAIAGDADLVLNIPTSSVARVTGAGRSRVDRIIIPRVHILMPNIAQPQFAEARVRQALSAAIDRNAIATTIMRNPALAATYYLPPAFKSWADPGLAPLPYDVALANRLLDEAGWVRGGDGIRAKDGKRFAGTVKTFVNRPELPAIATALQAQFRQVGYELAIKIGDFAEIVEAQKDGSLELGLSSRNVAIVPEPIASIGIDFTGDVSPGGAVGATNWKNQPMRDAVAAYVQTVDEQRVTALRRQIAAILQNELPVIPICWYEQIVAVGTDIDGFVSDPFDQRYFLDRMRRKA